MDALLPIENRIKKLVEDFFSKKMTLFEFKCELRRMREEFEPDEKTNQKVKEKPPNEDVLPEQTETTQADHPRP